MTKIEWTEKTWNPVTGCTKVSPGCRNCYAERMAHRLQAMENAKYANGFAITYHPEALDEPSRWKRPRLVFVCSMGDLFHEDVPTVFIKRVFKVIEENPRHEFQILTKRGERLQEFRDWPMNAWIGVSVENADYVYRIDHVRHLPASVRFVSFEPLLGPIPDLDLEDIDWVIVGGESGPGSRPMNVEWVRNIHDQCVFEGVPFFFKQWGGVHKKRTGRLLDGRTWEEYPI